MFLAVGVVLLVAYVYTKSVHADEISKVNSAYVSTQKEASKIKSQLKIAESAKERLDEETRIKEEKIQQLEKENSELKG